MTHNDNRRPDRGGGAVEAAATTTAMVADLAGITRKPSVWAQIPAWQKATPAQRRQVVDAVLGARRVAHDRRLRVLAHPDIARRLVTELGLERAENWSGYVPPRIAYFDGQGRSVPNDSPRREALMAILTAVMEREGAP